MARVNITIPDELLAQAREAGLNVSKLAAGALAEELDRRSKIRALEEYLAELDAELGPMTPEEEAAGKAWAERVFGPLEIDGTTADDRRAELG